MKDEDIPSDCYIRHQAEGIDIICSNIGLAGTEVQLVNAMSREYVLKQILYGIKDQYDAVIIDCMPSLGMITINLIQGTKVMVEGEIVTGNYEDKDTGKKIYTTEVYANRIEFAGAKMVDRPPFPEDAEGFLEIPEGMEEEMPFR